MRSKGFEGMRCSIAGVLDAVGDRWATLILRDLGFGVCRYEDLRRSTNVTNATLSDRLKHLEANDLVERRLYQSSPDRYEYVLTSRGRDILLVIMALAQVGDKWQISGDNGAPVRFVSKATGRPVKIAIVDDKSGTTVRARDIRPRAGPGADDMVHWRIDKFESGTPSS
jgi:DNA-binding HxlR family transcriptional regulator